VYRFSLSFHTRPQAQTHTKVMIKAFFFFLSDKLLSVYAFMFAKRPLLSSRFPFLSLSLVEKYFYAFFSPGILQILQVEFSLQITFLVELGGEEIYFSVYRIIYCFKIEFCFFLW
jgi:hypothetical protein